MNILSLLQLALSLLVSVQAPGVSVELRQQALDTARQIVEIASTQIQSMNTQNQPQPIAQPPQPAPQSSTPSEPILGSTTFVPEPAFKVTIGQVTTLEKGGEFFFTIEGKTGTSQVPELVLDEVTTNLRPGQTFYKVWPIEGTTNSYRVGISVPKAQLPQNPYIQVKIGNDVIEQSITIQ